MMKLTGSIRAIAITRSHGQCTELICIISLGVVHYRLRDNLSMNVNKSPYMASNNAAQSSTNLSPAVPKEYCFAYHVHNQHCTCMKCNFKHTCHICYRGEHPRFLCKTIRMPNHGVYTVCTTSNLDIQPVRSLLVCKTATHYHSNG